MIMSSGDSVSRRSRRPRERREIKSEVMSLVRGSLERGAP